MGTSTAAGELPVQRTPFLGREGELRRITELMADPACRLLTLVGPGGIGKTRLALAAAAGAPHSSFPDGVYFVALKSLTSPEYIVTTISGALGRTLKAGHEPTPQLLELLQGKSMLLVLDNFEHLLEGAVLLAEILSTAPEAKLLVTSRERLRLVEEWVLEVGGLDYPAPGDTAQPERYSAIQLFNQHAGRVANNFQLSAAQVPSVIHICQLTGGMPLAIELAAVWVRALSCEDIAAEIERGLDILESPARNADPRHRTIRAVFEPTWMRLSETERSAYQRLSVFRGGFTHEAAEQVAGASVNILANIVDRSLLRLNRDERYDLHELLRQYAAEQLQQSAESDVTLAAHSAYFAGFLQQRLDDLKGRRQIAAMREIDADFENVRTAWNYAASHHQQQIIEKMIDALGIYCEIRERDAEGVALFQSAERQFAPAPGEEPTRFWGRLLVRAVDAATWKERANRALEIARQHEDWPEIAFCLRVLGMEPKQEPQPAVKLLQQSLEIYNRLEDRYAMSRVLAGLRGTVRDSWDDFSRYGEGSLIISREIGDRIGVAWALSTVAINKMREGNFVQAEQLWLERIALGYEIGYVDLVVGSLGHISQKVYFYLGDFARARATAEESLRAASRREHFIYGRYWAQASLGLLACMEEDYEEGMHLLKQIIAEVGETWAADLATWGLSIAACGLGEYDAAREYLHLSLKLHVEIHGMPAIVGSFPMAAAILAKRGDLVRAVELLALAFTHPVRASGWMEKWPLLARLRSELETALGSDAYTAAWERGKRLDAETVLAAIQTEFRTPIGADPPEAIGSAPSSDEPLNARELEILRLIADGVSTREAAQHLYLSVETVRWYLRQIYDKLDVHTRVQAVTRARAMKLLL